MTSTYVQQLVSAMVGDTATVEMMSTSNIDIMITTQLQLIKSKSSDAFFYHGLELEPWVTGPIFRGNTSIIHDSHHAKRRNHS